MGPHEHSRADEEFWRDFLTHGPRSERLLRRLLKLLPGPPRCRMCAAPFGGPGSALMRAVGKRRAPQNPNWCTSCFTYVSRHHGGAEIECTFLFADVRGSTSIAERSSTAELHALMDRFYDTASAVVFEHDGLVDKFVGDELVAMFFPLLSGERHAGRAVEAALALLRATGHADPEGPWLPVGAGVHTGDAWVGAVGSGGRTELTALGDAVNVTARLASEAAAGEILVSADTADKVGVGHAQARRRLELKGKSEPIEIIALTVGSRNAA